MGLRSVHRKIFFILTFCLVTKVFVSIQSGLNDTTIKTKRDTKDETIPDVSDHNPVPPRNVANVEAKNGAFALKRGQEDPIVSSDKKKNNIEAQPGLKISKEEVDTVIGKQNGAFSIQKKKRLEVHPRLKSNKKELDEAKKGAF